MFIDILFIFLLFGSVALGFFHGIIRLFILLVTFYVSLVLASLYFLSLGVYIQHRYGAIPETARYVSFTIVLVLSFVLLTFIALYTLRNVTLAEKYRYFDRVSGVLLGILLAIVVTSIVAALLWNFLHEQQNQHVAVGWLAWLASSAERSVLLNSFANYVVPHVYPIVGSLLPSADVKSLLVSSGQ